MQITQCNHYTILGIPTPQTADDPSITPELVKSAYRKALLRYHPDRKPGVGEQGQQGVNFERVNDKASEKGTVSIDQIREAYEVLIDPLARRKYHSSLAKTNGTGLGKGTERSAVETIDLEELECREGEQGAVWERVCRCGGVYRVSERQLGEVAGDGEGDGHGQGEIVMGCSGCSLVIRVVFEVVEG